MCTQICLFSGYSSDITKTSPTAEAKKKGSNRTRPEAWSQGSLFHKGVLSLQKEKKSIVDFSLAPKVMLLGKTTNSNTFASKGFLNLLQIPSSCLRGNCVQASDKIMQAYQNTLFPLLIWLSLAT